MSLIQSQSALIAAIITLALAIRISLQERRPGLFYSFAILNTLLFLWNLSQFFSDLVDWEKQRAFGDYLVGGVRYAGILAGAFIPASAFHFFQLFMAHQGQQDSIQNRNWRLLVAVAIALSPFIIVLWDHHWVKALVFSYVFISLYYCLVPIGRRLSDTRGKVEAVRLKYLAVGGFASISFALLDILPGLEAWWPGMEPWWPGVGNVTLVIYLFFLSEMLIQSRLMGLGELFGKLVVLIPMALVLAVVYVLLSLLSEETSRWFLFNTTIMMAFVVAILYEPMKAWVEERFNQILFKERFEFAHQMGRLHREIATIVEEGELSQIILRRLEDSKRVTHASLYLLDDAALRFRLVGSLGDAPGFIEAAKERVFFEYLKENRVGVLTNIQDDREEALNVDSVLVERLDRVLAIFGLLKASVCVPVTSGDRVLGLLAVNDDRMREDYAHPEINALLQIGVQAAISIENSRVVSALREKDRLAAVGEMAAGLAHEIRNPLGAIKGAVQCLSLVSFLPSLEDEEESPEDFCNIIVEETNRLNKVVSQFLDYARPYRGEPERCEINQVVERSVTLFRQEALERRVEIELDLSPGLPDGRVDPERLRQVILNLAINGIHAAAKRANEACAEEGDGFLPTLKLRTCSTDRNFVDGGRKVSQEMLEIAIIDNGMGMSDEVKANLFIPFFTTKEQGTGLGLAISRRIVENFGHLEFSSMPGEGTIFRIIVPFWDAMTQPAPEVKASIDETSPRA